MNLTSFSPYSARDIKGFFAAHKAGIRKRWGQNFLIDPNINHKIAKIISASCKEQGSSLLEVGPGFGSLTKELLNAGHRVYAVEIDPVLFSFLEKEAWQQTNKGGLWLIQADIISLLEGFLTRKSFFFQKTSSGAIEHSSLVLREGRLFADQTELKFFCGNLPYPITTNFLLHLMRLSGIRGGVFLVQKEYALRILDSKKTHSIGAFLHNCGSWKLHTHIKARVFYPSPKVESSLIEYQAHRSGPRCSPLILEKLLRLSFSSRRKKIQNNWKKHLAIYFPQLRVEQLSNWGQEYGIHSDLRAEDISRDSFYSLCRKIEAHTCSKSP